ncbi:nucleoside/nucleotide kinase family protein [Curtobacterium sp. Leaf261]|uniref:nucleoside/nucleotide kinase family protein n=1 Tax=Curtobacterium sp. Leaf261 TaxID=1736311 RepID=UPI0006F44EA9|nr:nucleoside/nucleotide kinase family protein [Curtobacterium sp. Leaf261]KQO63823.1 fructose transporter [Curtobacterium sp. Leaf261]
MPTPISVDAAVERALALTRGAAGRVVLGITGSPGSGKSTLARRVVAAVTAELGPAVAVQVPMDGFHLANGSLEALGRRGRKGAIDTFDAEGYVALVRRLAAASEPVTWAPDFDRRVDEPVAGSIAVPRRTRLVVTEGNYLLDATDPWDALPGLLAESWFCRAAPDVRVDRLVGRHMRHGRDFAAARAWAVDVDGSNADRVEPTADRATVVVLT